MTLSAQLDQQTVAIHLPHTGHCAVKHRRVDDTIVMPLAQTPPYNRTRLPLWTMLLALLCLAVVVAGIVDLIFNTPLASILGINLAGPSMLEPATVPGSRADQ